MQLHKVSNKTGSFLCFTIFKNILFIFKVATALAASVKIPAVASFESPRSRLIKYLQKEKCKRLGQHIKDSRTEYQTFASFDFNDLDM